MKKVLLVFSVMAGVIAFSSCNQKSQKATVEEITVSATPDEIVKDSVFDDKGNKIYLTFNNSKGSVDVLVNGEVVTMKQDTTASGIKFSNAQYEYEEWQGKITLKKDGNVIFENKK